MIDDFPQSKMSRRTLLLGAAMTGAAHALAQDTAQPTERSGASDGPPGKLEICVFSKHLQWTNVAEAAAIARDIGFNGIDLTVRPQGHVLPERVETDLPAAVEAVRRAGLKVPMISTEITSAHQPHTEAILKTASAVGIRHYRWGGLTYPDNTGIAERLNELKPQAKELADLNKEHQICGMYHTHSGPGLVGAPIWDLWTMFQNLDPRWIGVNYDIGHATVEGGYGGWIASARLVKNQMSGIALKDFAWEQNKSGNTRHDPYDKSLGTNDAWVPHWCPIGRGMVNFQGFFAIVKANGFSGPVQLHFEYPGLGGAENGDKKLSIPRQQLIDAMRKDLTSVKAVMHDQQLL
jgi:sugar phosphate isomerase/epimerase